MYECIAYEIIHGYDSFYSIEYRLKHAWYYINIHAHNIMHGTDHNQLKGIVSVYIAKFSNRSRKGIPNKQSSAWVSHLVTSSSSEYSIATKHTQ